MLAAIRFLLFFLCSIQLWANTSTKTWYSIDAKKQVSINVDLFLSSTCEHCHKADEFFKGIELHNPWLHVQRHIINQDKEALTLFNQFLSAQNLTDFSVPSIFFCNSRWIGFATAETTGKDLMNALQYCKKQIEIKGSLTQTTADVIKRWANANMFNSSVTDKPTILHYLMAVVFLDAGNPCSLFCGLCFLAVLFIQNSKRNQFITGCLFTAAVVLVHCLQQTQTNLFYQILPWYRIFAVLISLSSLYLVVQYYKKQALKPYLLFIWTFVFALTVYAYQQTCVMNWSYVFQQWLTNQQLATGQEFALQVIYQIFYGIPLMVVLLLYLLFSSFNFINYLKPSLENMGLIFLALTALVMLIQPASLSAYLVSYLAFLIAFIGGFIVNRYRMKKDK